jgi:carbonic anhydrase/acetyltransferase-like protein (isoleucine patch superfamily)
MLSVLLLVSLTVGTHPGAAAAQNRPSFTDPTASVQCGPGFRFCDFGSAVYIAPFATIKAGPSSLITIRDSSNVQDNALLDTTTNNRPITLGKMAIIAHGASVFGGTRIGETGTCPPGRSVCPSFIGFNSEVAENAVVQSNAMVMHLARVGPGVTIPSGRAVLPGKNVTSNSEVPAKTVEVVDGDNEFMDAVIEVNIALAAGYTELQRQDPSNVLGINFNPVTDLNPTSILPSFNGRSTRDPLSRSRIIGDVRFANAVLPTVGMNVSLRADEGTPIEVGTIGSLADLTTFHALEHTQLRLGNNGTYGRGSVVHGGKTYTTSTGSNFVLGDNSVFYNSTAADNCRVGAMSLVDKTNLPANTVIRPGVVVMSGQQTPVEWARRPRKKTKGNRRR